jgi:RNA polymerase sigma factor (sigma-70 family)
LEQTADTLAMEAAALPSRRRRPLRGRLLRGTSDEALVARVRAGDAAAFEGIYDRYHRGLLAFCRYMLGTREEAEDAVQHTFLAAYRNLRAGEHEIRLKAWLYTIARNRCLSMLRARREQVELDEARVAAPALEGLASEVQRRDDLRQMLGDLERLPDEQRAALVLFELGDHSHEDIATILDVRKEKVKALVFQARESLLTSRTARDTPCAEIREQLSTLTGGALRRSTLRRHVEQCPGCQAFESEVKRQRAAMLVLLPVVPTAGMKSSVLAATAGAATGAGAVAGGTAAGTFAGLGAKGVATKLAVTAAVAATAGGGGYVAVHKIGHSGSRAPAAHQRATPATPAKPARPGRATPAVPATPASPASSAAAAHAHGKGASSTHRGGASAGSAVHAKGAKAAHGAAHAKRKPVVHATRKQGSQHVKAAPDKTLRAHRRGTSAGRPVHGPSLRSSKRPPATTPPPRAAHQEPQPTTTAPTTTTTTDSGHAHPRR